MAADQLEVVMIGGDHAGSVGAGRECDQHVEVEIAELFGREAVFGVDRGQELAGFDPIFLGGSENGVVLRQRKEEFAFSAFVCAAPEFRKHNS